MNKAVQLFEEFVKELPSEITQLDRYLRGINKIREIMAEHNGDIDFKCIQNYIRITGGHRYTRQILMLYVLFAINLDKKGELKGDLASLFAKYEKSILTYFSGFSEGKRELVTSEDFSPISIIVPVRKSISKKEKKYQVLIFPNITEDIHEFILNYFASLGDDKLMESRFRQGMASVYKLFCEQGCLYTDINKYDDNTFLHHFKIICQEIPSKKISTRMTLLDCCLAELINFYNWIETLQDEETRKKNFKKFTLRILKYPYLTSAIRDGFEVVNYSIHDNPPEVDKWIINPQNMELHQTATADKLTSLDLSVVQNVYLKKWIKECYWFDDAHSIRTRTKDYGAIFDFIGAIDKKFKKNELPSIGVDDVLSYKASCIAKNVQDSTVARKLSFIKYFLNFINDKNYLVVDHLLFRLLVYHDSEGNAYKETYTKEEIKSLLDAYKDSYEKCTAQDRRQLYTLYYYVIAIQCVSEMRVSTILNLKSGCVVKTLERNEHSEYKVIVQSKTSGRDFDEYNITRYVKGLLDEVKALTSDLRSITLGIEKEYLFIYRRSNHKFPGIVRQEALAAYHKKVCKEYGIRELQLGAIRNYYQQQVSEYVFQNGDDPMLIERLSKHGINVHIRHYDTVDIKDFCQRFYQVEIGSIELKGRVEEINDKPKQNEVAHGCGHCTLSECVLRGNLECLMCDKFVTTLDCIPFFEKEIERIDEMIINQPLQHEKEFLNSKKRLNVAYLTKLYELEDEINGNSCV